MLDHLKFMALLALLVVQTGCGTLDGPLSGVVIDKSTGEPVEGAIIVAQWQGAVASPAHSQTECYHAETATTKEDGTFRIPAFLGGPWYIMNKRSFVSAAYKEGYRQMSNREIEEANVQEALQDVIYLVPFAGARAERMKYLSTLAPPCEGLELVPLYRALYEEANKIAVTKQEKLKALSRLYDLEKQTIGADSAWENFKNRKREIK